MKTKPILRWVSPRDKFEENPEPDPFFKPVRPEFPIENYGDYLFGPPIVDLSPAMWPRSPLFDYLSKKK